MTLLDAHPYDPAKARRRKIKITVTVVIVVALAALAWMYRNWPEEHSVDKFFAALQQKDLACSTFAEVGRKAPNAPQNVKAAVERERKRVHC